MIGLVILAAGLVALVLLTRWLLAEGYRHGDDPLDALSRIETGPDGTAVVVINPDSAPVVIGMACRRYRTARFEQLRVPFAARAPRRHERRRLDRGAAVVLGVVPAGGQGRWSVPSVSGMVRITLTIGQANARLRVHEHLVHARRPGPATRPAAYR